MDKELARHKVLLPNQPWGATAALIVGVIAYIVAQLGLVLLILPLFSLNGTDSSDELLATPWISLLVSAFSSALMLGVVWLFLKRRNVSLRSLGFYKPNAKGVGITLGAYGVYFLALISAFVALPLIFSGFNAEQTQDIGYVGANGWQLILAFIGLVIIAPVAEEIFFRGFIYRGLRRSWPAWVAAITASVLFGLAHMQWNVGIDVFLMSLALIYVFEKTGNLWLCIAFHSAKNLIAFLALFIFIS